MSQGKHRSDETVGQPRRATDSRPRPESGTPTEQPAPAEPSEIGDRRSNRSLLPRQARLIPVDPPRATDH